jgi:hypothetical protein
MAQNNPTDAQPSLASVSLRYPEKTFFLSQVFKDTTNSYKLFWFLAILSKLKHGTVQGSLQLEEVLTEMAVAAWHPVCLYRLSLGRQDKLQEVILNIQRESNLVPSSEPEVVRNALQHSLLAQSRLAYFKRYVPTRFLSPWFNSELRGVRDTHKDRRILRMALESQATTIPSLYFFEARSSNELIKLNDSWRVFLEENLGIVRSFAEHSLALYLQSRNPGAFLSQ